MSGRIHVGVGGWTFEPWRGTFFPPGLPRARELEYAAARLSAIEVNGTFYRTQTPATFRRWAAETPDAFVFTLKGPGYVANRRILAEAGEGVARFVGSGITELGRKLGPILWQFAPSRTFDAADIEAFLQLLPRRADGIALRHAIEVRHQSFRDPAFLSLARAAGASVVYADSDTHPAIADLTGPFVYARLQKSAENEVAGYPAADLARWAERAQIWAVGGDPADLPHLDATEPASNQVERQVFIFFISGAKVQNPAAAQAMIAALGRAEM